MMREQKFHELPDPKGGGGSQRLTFSELSSALEPLGLNADRAKVVSRQLGKHYSNLVERGIEIVLQGRSGGWGTTTSWLNRGVREEQKLGEELELFNNQIVEVRHLLLASQILAQLRLFEKEDSKTYAAVLSAVRDRTIDTLQDFIYRPGSPSLNDPACRAEMGPRYLAGYIRPLVFLNVVKNHPDIVSSLQSDSSYILHHHFLDDSPALPSKAQIIRESDMIVAQQLVASISDDFAARLARVPALIKESRAMERGGSRAYANGKFSLEYGVGFDFTNLDIKQIGLQIAELFGTKERKKELFTILAEVLNLRGSTLSDLGSNSATILKDRRSNFSTTENQYRIIRNTLEAYAHNQIVHMYHETDQSFVARPYLAKLLGIRAQKVGDNLEIVDRKNSKRTVMPSMENPFYDTNIDLPVAIAVLALWHRNALKLCPSETE